MAERGANLVVIQDALASTVADEIEGLRSGFGPDLVFAAATVTVGSGDDVEAGAIRWGNTLAAVGGGVWLVAEARGNPHFHGVAAGHDVARMAAMLGRANQGSPFAQHLHRIDGAEHLRRVIRYATKLPSWDPDEVIATGVFVTSWIRACSTAGATLRRHPQVPMPALSSNEWVEEIRGWPSVLREFAAERAQTYAAFSAASRRQLAYWAYVALRASPLAKTASRSAAVDPQRGTSPPGVR